MSDSPAKSSTKVVVKQKPAPVVSESTVSEETAPEIVASPPVVDAVTPSDDAASPAVEAIVPPPAAPAIKPATVVTPAPVELSREALTVQSMLSEYQQLLSPAIVTQSAIHKSVLIMSRICDVICTTPHDDARDVLWEFHHTHKDGLMREDMGLRGLRGLVGKQAHRVATVYTLYRHKVIKSGLTQGYDQARPHTSQALLLYMDRKN